MPVVQGICDELIEVWGERGSVSRCQWDLVSSDESEGGGKAEEKTSLGEQHFST